MCKSFESLDKQCPVTVCLSAEECQNSPVCIKQRSQEGISLLSEWMVGTVLGYCVQFWSLPCKGRAQSWLKIEGGCSSHGSHCIYLLVIVVQFTFSICKPLCE